MYLYIYIDIFTGACCSSGEEPTVGAVKSHKTESSSHGLVGKLKDAAGVKEEEKPEDLARAECKHILRNKTIWIVKGETKDEE